MYLLMSLLMEAVKLSMSTNFDAWVKAESETVFMVFTVGEATYNDFAPDAMGFNVGEGVIKLGYYSVTEINFITFSEAEAIIFVLTGV